MVHDELVPDLLDNIEAAALAVDDGPRPNAGSWCDRCSYRTVCPASKDIRYEPVEYYEDDED
jgi:CRISPR/Cas system-associated exonuclease Cas4 (RecB family)